MDAQFLKGNAVLHAPGSVVGGFAGPDGVFKLTQSSPCSLSDVMPAKTIVLAALLLYVSISTNYLTLSQGVARFIFAHPYVRIIIVFILAFFIVDYKGPFRFVSRIASAALITLIYQLIIGISEDADCSEVVAGCPDCLKSAAEEENVLLQPQS